MRKARTTTTPTAAPAQPLASQPTNGLTLTPQAAECLAKVYRFILNYQSAPVTPASQPPPS